MLDPGAQIPGLAGNFIDFVIRFALFPVQQRCMQQAADLFVGIHREDPFSGCTVGRKILLLRIVCPRAREKRRAMLRATCSVPSVLPESTTTISSAMPVREERARGRFCSSFSVMMQAVMRFIAFMGSFET